MEINGKTASFTTFAPKKQKKKNFAQLRSKERACEGCVEVVAGVTQEFSVFKQNRKVASYILNVATRVWESSKFSKRKLEKKEHKEVQHQQCI